MRAVGLNDKLDITLKDSNGYTAMDVANILHRKMITELLGIVIDRRERTTE